MFMKAEAPLVYCLVLNLNGRELLGETLDSVQRMTYPNFKVVVIDNGSNDGSREVVRSGYPSATLIENETNLGFGEGNNVGMRYALEHGAQWIFLLNYDIAVDPNLLTELMNAAMTEPNVGILGPKIYYHAEPNMLWYAGGRINYFTGVISHRGVRQEDRGQYDAAGDTQYVTGCAFLVRREVLEKVGLFDPAYYPAYSEDADLSVRAQRAGYRLRYVPQARLWHKVSASSGGGMTPMKTRLKVEHNLIFFRRYARWYHWLTIPWCVGGIAVAFVVKELLKGNFRIVGALAGGFVQALKRAASK
ncbi:MAG: glycosyltransferase family 2 protein [Bacteroidota bacterium]|jgi:GT2 family glycosyltransferase